MRHREEKKGKRRMMIKWWRLKEPEARRLFQGKFVEEWVEAYSVAVEE